MKKRIPTTVITYKRKKGRCSFCRRTVKDLGEHMAKVHGYK